MLSRDACARVGYRGPKHLRECGMQAQVCVAEKLEHFGLRWRNAKSVSRISARIYYLVHILNILTYYGLGRYTSEYLACDLREL